MHPLELSLEQLAEIAMDFEKRIQQGLGAWDQQIRCMPTHIPLGAEVQAGKAAVLDLGGSNLRAGIVSRERGEWRLLERSPDFNMPWQRNVPFSRHELLEIQAGILSKLTWEEDLPLGYCFSYPAQPTPERDVVLLKWAKGIDVPGTVGQEMGALLLSYLHKHRPGIHCSDVTVINDTVAALLGGMEDLETTSTIGLIAGTGTNLAATFSLADIPKMPNDDQSSRQLPVNLESGNYAPPYLTQWDKDVDQNSNNPGEQLFEKAVSGAYLGYIFKALFPESDFEERKGGAELAKILMRPKNYPADWVDKAGLIYFRSSDLVAAALAGLIKLLQGFNPKPRVRIVAEGALFWGQLDGQSRYRDRVASRLTELVSMLELSHMQVEFFKRADTNLIGSAIAALS